MSRPAAVLFDLDDTLYAERRYVDGGFAAVAAFLSPLTGRSAEALTSRLIALHDEQGRGRLFDTLLAELGRIHDPDLVLACLLVYRTHTPILEPFPGVVEALATLRAAGIRTGVVSDGHAATQHRKLAALPDVLDRLDAVVMTDDLGPGHAKPSPTPFRVAALLLGIRPVDAVYIANDRRKDFHGAREAGLRTIRVGRQPDEGRATMALPSTAFGEDAHAVAEDVATAMPLLLNPGGEP
jgi:putative hydrolase of the HAD superfamily